MYIKMNKKVPRKIIRKIDIKNVIRVFVINRSIININFKKTCNVFNISFSDYLIRNFFVYFYVKNTFQYFFFN